MHSFYDIVRAREIRNNIGGCLISTHLIWRNLQVGGISATKLMREFTRLAEFSSS